MSNAWENWNRKKIFNDLVATCKESKSTKNHMVQIEMAIEPSENGLRNKRFVLHFVGTYDMVTKCIGELKATFIVRCTMKNVCTTFILN